MTESLWEEWVRERGNEPANYEMRFRFEWVKHGGQVPLDVPVFAVVYVQRKNPLKGDSVEFHYGVWDGRSFNAPGVDKRWVNTVIAFAEEEVQFDLGEDLSWRDAGPEELLCEAGRRRLGMKPIHYKKLGVDDE